MTITGTVERITSEDDGDVHINVKLDPAFASLINDRNESGENDDHVAEIVPADEPGYRPSQSPKPTTGTYDYGCCAGADIQTPKVCGHVQVIGPYVLSADHRWMEIYPIWSLTEQETSSSPPPNSDSGGQAIASVSKASPTK